jgi:ribosomal protein S2
MFEFHYLLLQILFELGVHVGSSCTYNVNAWHAYILGRNSGRFIINITYSLIVLQKVFKLCVLLFLNNRKIYIADNHRRYRDNGLLTDLHSFAKSYKQVSSIVWYPGLLTNIKVLSKFKHRKTWQKVHFNYGRIIPSVVFLFSLNRCYSATHEALKLRIPLICVVDTLADPSYIDYPVFSNTCNIDLLQYYIMIIRCAWFIAKVLKVTKKSSYIVSWYSMKNKFEILRNWIDQNHFTQVSREHSPFKNFKKRLKRQKKKKLIFTTFSTTKQDYTNLFNFRISSCRCFLIPKRKKFFLYRRFRSVRTLKSYLIKFPLKNILKRLSKDILVPTIRNSKRYNIALNLLKKNEKIILLLMKNKKFNICERILFSIIDFLQKTYFCKRLLHRSIKKYSNKFYFEIFHFLLNGVAKFALTKAFLKEDFCLRKRYNIEKKKILGKVA